MYRDPALQPGKTGRSAAKRPLKAGVVKAVRGAVLDIVSDNDGSVARDVHAESVVLLHPETTDLEQERRADLVFEEEREDPHAESAAARRSPGQMIEHAARRDRADGAAEAARPPLPRARLRGL